MFYKVVQWHFSGEMDNSQTLFAQSTQDFVRKKLLKSVELWLRYSKVKLWTV